MNKTSNSQGYITFRNDRKTWCVRYNEFDVKNNKNITKSKTFKTREEAEKYLTSIMYQKENPIYIEHNGIPLCELMKSNLNLKFDTNQISEVTYNRTMQTINQIERFPIGQEKIDEITSEELQEFMNYHKYLSNSTIDKLFHQLGSAFKLAINRGYLTRNPMVNVLKPKSNKEDKEVRALTFEEQQAITDYLLTKDITQCKYKNVYLIQMFMGLRVGEALALSTYDIDLQNKRLNVKKTLTKDLDGNTIMGKSTKTYFGKRTLPIPDYLITSIMEQMVLAENQNNNDEKLLFKPEYMKYTKRENVNSELKRLLKRHFGITDITTHSLRHTYGTRCIEAGMAPVVVQKLMGHKDVSITLNTYTSVFDKFKEKEIDKVNKYYLEENMLKAVKMLQEEDKEIYSKEDIIY